MKFCNGSSGLELQENLVDASTQISTRKVFGCYWALPERASSGIGKSGVKMHWELAMGVHNMKANIGSSK